MIAGLGERSAGLLHLLGEQGRAVNLDDLQGPAREVQQVGGAQQRAALGVAVDVLFELATRVVERARELAIDQLERMRREIVQVADRHTGGT